MLKSFLVLFISLALTQAASLAWSNAAGGDFNTAANWNPAQVPTSADDVTLGIATSASITATGTINVQSVTVSNAGTTLAIQSQALFTTGSLTWASGSITVGEDNAAFTITNALTVSSTTNVTLPIGFSATVKAGSISSGTVTFYTSGLGFIDLTATTLTGSFNFGSKVNWGTNSVATSAVTVTISSDFYVLNTVTINFTPILGFGVLNVSSGATATFSQLAVVNANGQSHIIRGTVVFSAGLSVYPTALTLDDSASVTVNGNTLNLYNGASIQDVPNVVTPSTLTLGVTNIASVGTGSGIIFVRTNILNAVAFSAPSQQFVGLNGITNIAGAVSVASGSLSINGNTTFQAATTISQGAQLNVGNNGILNVFGGITSGNFYPLPTGTVNFYNSVTVGSATVITGTLAAQSGVTVTFTGTTTLGTAATFNTIGGSTNGIFVFGSANNDITNTGVVATQLNINSATVQLAQSGTMFFNQGSVNIGSTGVLSIEGNFRVLSANAASGKTISGAGSVNIGSNGQLFVQSDILTVTAAIIIGGKLSPQNSTATISGSGNCNGGNIALQNSNLFITSTFDISGCIPAYIPAFGPSNLYFNSPTTQYYTLASGQYNIGGSIYIQGNSVVTNNGSVSVVGTTGVAGNVVLSGSASLIVQAPFTVGNAIRVTQTATLATAATLTAASAFINSTANLKVLVSGTTTNGLVVTGAASFKGALTVNINSTTVPAVMTILTYNSLVTGSTFSSSAAFFNGSTYTLTFTYGTSATTAVLGPKSVGTTGTPATTAFATSGSGAAGTTGVATPTTGPIVTSSTTGDVESSNATSLLSSFVFLVMIAISLF